MFFCFCALSTQQGGYVCATNRYYYYYVLVKTICGEYVLICIIKGHETDHDFLARPMSESSNDLHEIRKDIKFNKIYHREHPALLSWKCGCS